MVWSLGYYLPWGDLVRCCERVAAPMRKSGGSQIFDVISSY